MSPFSEQGHPRDLVVGYETREFSGAALEFAAALALRLNARLSVVHVENPLDHPSDADLAGSDLETEYVRISLGHHRACVDRILADFPGEWSYRNETGDPLHRLNAIARECDALMIVIGGPGVGPGTLVHRLLDRSVAKEMAKHADRAVLIVPGHRVDRDTTGT
ncbi:universal stress protein [Embleya sp. NBC_00896]|uniref:universal stress protein n=1 Tax=Embleya sp. NBC_00896 TaxID=2975961 RepID=UPI002F90B307|nr:universal stress protein [Embleya sp. NBC_00896]